jgi:2-methylisocitrate lyase-like PEP mutase family enzyme
MNQHEKAQVFAALHTRARAFVIPNPWDSGSARVFEGLGFEALATTSSGYAQTLGRLDGDFSMDEKLAHCANLCAVTSVPVNADLENCFADAPEAAAANLARFAATGLAGGSIEDYSRDGKIYDQTLAVERVSAAVESVRAMGFPFVLTARAEGLLRKTNTLDEVIERLQAFSKAGADVLYAPGLTTLEQVRAVTAAVDRPVNVLVPPFQGCSVDELYAAGAVRLSLGGAAARMVLGSMMRAGDEMLGAGTFTWLADIASGADMKKFFG